MEIILKNKRGLELVISPFSDHQMCSEVFLVIKHLVIFDGL